MFKKYLFLVVLLGAATLLTAQNLDAERLPDMKAPRAGHNVFYADGDLIVTGGIIDDNFTPLSSVWLLHTGTEKALSETNTHSWLWILCSLAFIAIVVIIAKHIQKTTKPVSQPDATSKEMMARITNLMETKQLYLNKDLKVFDLAEALGTNKNTVSACINENGSSFSQLVNDYRLEYAKNLLRQSPDKKIATVWMDAGFASERTFFRAFKTATGMTPSEWTAIK